MNNLAKSYFAKKSLFSVFIQDFDKPIMCNSSDVARLLRSENLLNMIIFEKCYAVIFFYRCGVTYVAEAVRGWIRFFFSEIKNVVT